LSGSHYQKTAEAWLVDMDKYRHEIRAVFNTTYGKKQARIWQQRWRIFLWPAQNCSGIATVMSGG
jgi:cyclopropane-fatty-acyl-phospholipid synthase